MNSRSLRFLFAFLMLASASLACNLTNMLVPKSKDQANVPPAVVEKQDKKLIDPIINNDPEAAGEVCTQWRVQGRWMVNQKNYYDPEFQITQDGTKLSGTATLTQANADAQHFSGTVGTGTGSMVGSDFSFTVTWPARTTDGVVVSGTYAGTVAASLIHSDSWFAIGPSYCLKWEKPAP